MDTEWLKHKTRDFLKKYRYAVLVMLIGVMLMNLPHTHSGKSPPVQSEKKIESISLEEKIGSILSDMQGAGQVKVMLTVSESPVVSYQENTDRIEEQDRISIKTDTVTVSDESRKQAGLVKETKAETYRGAVILCQGADNASVKLAVTEAVSKITGLSTDRISVLKMK